MDIAKLSTNVANVKVAQGVQVGMLKRAMEHAEQTGVQIAEMIQVSAPPKESTID